MFWAAISSHGKSPLIQLHWEDVVYDKNGKAKKAGFRGHHYAEQVIKGPLRKFYEEQKKLLGGEIEVVEDGAGPHKGAEVNAARAAIGYPRLTHPASSPDLNPIEPLWRVLKDRIWDVPGAHNSLPRLIQAAHQVWDAITLEDIRKHTGAMHDRVLAVIEAKGMPTKY